MIRTLLTIDTGLWVVVTAGLTTWVVNLKRRIRAIDHPMLAMSRRQRRKWAQDEAARRSLQQDLDIVQGK